MTCGCCEGWGFGLIPYPYQGLAAARGTFQCTDGQDGPITPGSGVTDGQTGDETMVTEDGVEITVEEREGQQYLVTRMGPDDELSAVPVTDRDVRRLIEMLQASLAD